MKLGIAKDYTFDLKLFNHEKNQLNSFIHLHCG
jgi:hypothetical protein